MIEVLPPKTLNNGGGDGMVGMFILYTVAKF